MTTKRRIKVLYSLFVERPRRGILRPSYKCRTLEFESNPKEFQLFFEFICGIVYFSMSRENWCGRITYDFQIYVQYTTIHWGIEWWPKVSFEKYYCFYNGNIVINMKYITIQRRPFILIGSVSHLVRLVHLRHDT